MTGEVFSLPTERCEECHELRPAIGFVTLGEGYRNLCSRCYNRRYMQRMGLPELETVEFEPLTRLDARGAVHTFYFVVHLSTGLEISAFEWLDGGPGGYRFAVLEHPASPVREAHQVLVAKIERGLMEPYLAGGDCPEGGPDRTQVVGEAVNGRLEERDGRPRVIIDGREYGWEEFGRFLRHHTGFNFRLECFEPHDDPPITAHPARPHPLWWLDLGAQEEEPGTQGQVSHH
jgi:hypothetical protein